MYITLLQCQGSYADTTIYFPCYITVTAQFRDVLVIDPFNYVCCMMILYYMSRPPQNDAGVRHFGKDLFQTFVKARLVCRTDNSGGQIRHLGRFFYYDRISEYGAFAGGLCHAPRTHAHTCTRSCKCTFKQALPGVCVQRHHLSPIMHAVM